MRDPLLESRRAVLACLTWPLASCTVGRPNSEPNRPASYSARETRLISQKGNEFSTELVWSPDSKYIAGFGMYSRLARVWDAQGRVVATMDLGFPQAPSRKYDWSPTGRYLALPVDRTLCIWDTTNWTIVHTISGSIERARFNQLGQLAIVTGSNNGNRRIQILEERTWKEVSALDLLPSMFESPACLINGISFLSDGRSLAISVHIAPKGERSYRILFWNIREGPSGLLGNYITLPKESTPIKEFAISKDGTSLAAIGFRDSVDVFSLSRINSSSPPAPEWSVKLARGRNAITVAFASSDELMLIRTSDTSDSRLLLVPRNQHEARFDVDLPSVTFAVAPSPNANVIAVATHSGIRFLEISKSA